MKPKVFKALIFCAASMGMGSGLSFAATTDHPVESTSAKTPGAIPWAQVGARVGADYKGDGLSVVAAQDGVHLRCVFQRLEGEATSEGLWLTSSGTNMARDRFRIMAASVGRVTPCPPEQLAPERQNLETDVVAYQVNAQPLPSHGKVSLAGQTARFIRPGLVEEYSVSMDGVRQDFLVLERPAGVGQLTVRLDVSGAKVEPAAFGARLVLEYSGREIAYSRLRATDATGKELNARFEVTQGARRSRGLNLEETAGTSEELALIVDDAKAKYPIRIDPTFSDANWMSMGGLPGTDGNVRAAVADDSGNLYIGGNFTIVGDVSALRVAKWNGRTWSSLGAGIGGYDYPYVAALAVSGTDVYAAGWFSSAGGSPANCVAKWNGSVWTPLGSGLSGGFLPPSVFALAVSGTDLYAGGNFAMAGGSPASRIAKWNGNSWSALGSGLGGADYPFVSALAMSGSNLVAGGYFTTAGGNGVSYIAQWDGSSWSALGSGVNAPVAALAFLGSDLYAGGGFTTAGGNAANNIAKWNGNSWSALGSGMNSGVLSLAVSGSNLYAGGYFTNAVGGANQIAKWNGIEWSALGSGMIGTVRALAVAGGNVYAGGDFTTAGGIAANRIANWDGTNWVTLGSGMNGWVQPIAVYGSDLYVGGAFTSAGGIAANYIAKWNGTQWSALGSGLNSNVYALAVSSNDVYAGGFFTNAGGSAANYIAKWNGTSWSALGPGLNGVVGALAVSGSNVYAGGRFTTAGVIAATNIARWDGSNWSPLGSGMNAPVWVLAVSGGDLYAGGYFTAAGGSAANRIAKWDGSSWSPLGSGIEGEFPVVQALAASENELYAGGNFTFAGGNAANNIAKWNGSSWSALGSGMNNNVYALAVSGSNVYAGGAFTNAGGSTANQIAKWDGSSWSAMGLGFTASPDPWVFPYLAPDVSGLAVAGNDLYAGGHFMTAGGKLSPYLAHAYLLPLPSLSTLRSGTDINISWPSTNTADFVFEQATTLAIPIGWVTNAAGITDDGTNKSVTIPATNGPQYFRLRRP